MAPDMDQNATFLTTTEAAKRFRVDPSTVRRWIVDGHLKAYETPGGKYRIPVSEVERLLGSAA